MKQRDAVYTVIVAVLGSEPTGAVELTKDQRQTVVDSITTMISSGEVEFSTEASEKYNTESKIRTYVSGLVSNWVRKDSRLNGGFQYKPTNSGSRATTKDEQLKALQLVRKQVAASGDAVKLAEVDAAINARLAEIKPKKAKKEEPKIDTSDIPDDLKEALGIAI